jgi:hypothetical protein
MKHFGRFATRYNRKTIPLSRLRLSRGHYHLASMNVEPADYSAHSLKSGYLAEAAKCVIAIV